MPEYFTVDEFRALPDMAGESTERIEAAAAWAVSVIEREAGTSFVTRTVTDESHDGNTGPIVLRSPYVASVTSFTLGGNVVAGAFAARDGVLSLNGSSYCPGRGAALVTYQAGYSATPPPDIKEAALQATRWHLLEGRASNVHSPRQTSMTNEMGGTVNFAVAGTDRPTGYPEVDAVIVGWRNQLLMPSFA